MLVGSKRPGGVHSAIIDIALKHTYKKEKQAKLSKINVNEATKKILAIIGL